MDMTNLRELSAHKLALYFRDTLKEHPTAEASITAFLLTAVQRQSISPRVISVWLSVAQTPATLLQALEQEFSVQTRVLAIKRFFKLLRRKQWLQTWEGVGGTSGLMKMLQKFSVAEVDLCLVRFPRWLNGPAKTEKEARVTELLRGLLPDRFPDASPQTADERPLEKRYQRLVPGCDEDFVREIVHNGGPLLSERIHNRAVADKDLLRSHHELLRQECLIELFSPETPALRTMKYLLPLLQYAPDLPSSKPRFSESMKFSLLVLEKLVDRPDIDAPFVVLQHLIEPLLRRCAKKNVDSAATKKILDLSLTFLQAHSAEAKRLLIVPHGFFYACVKFWAASPARAREYEDFLVSVMRTINWKGEENMGTYSVILTWVPKQLRYPLLRLCFLHLRSGHPIDIGNVEVLRASLVQNWLPQLFFSIDKTNALKLLSRLRSTSVLGDFLLQGDGILSQPASQDASGANPAILLNMLDDDTLAVLVRATAAVDDEMKNAAKSREQVDRAFHANSALFYAISSGSLEVYGQCLIWARRFVRDPLTVKSIFARQVSNTEESLVLLSAIPDNLVGIRASDIAANLEHANRIIFDVFETVVSALKEQSFHLYDWTGPLQLIGDVIGTRMNRSTVLQKTLQLNDNQFYDLMWKDTLELLSKIERQGLQPEYENLLFNPWGFVQQRSVSLNGDWKTPSALEFIDNLAKERDNIWRKFRLTVEPATADLPAPLPRGLPIQSLCATFGLSERGTHGMTPFISARAERIVFAGPEALQTVSVDVDSTRAMGNFVESFPLALAIYILHGNPETKQQRALKAWRHALDQLSDRMTPEEAHRTWKKIFLQGYPEFDVPDTRIFETTTSMQYPLLPSEADPEEYMEWNPLETFKPVPDVYSRQLQPVTYLDLFIGTYESSRPQVGGYCAQTPQSTVGTQHGSTDIWSPYRLTRLEMNDAMVREGLVLSALLFLENRIPNHKSIFAKPFPSTKEARYPAVWLDMTFADSKTVGPVKQENAFQILQFFTSDLPPSILQQLSEASLNALFLSPPDNDAQAASLEKLAYGFLSLLTASDNPSRAIPIVLRAVLERPDSSSWHRKLLSLGFLRRLSSSQAKHLMQSFADGIAAKQQEILAFEAAPIIEGSKKPYIKITTIKHLAQILKNAEFVFADFTLDILASLFATATHIDVRVAIVQSLMGMLSECHDASSERLGNRIIDALKGTIEIASRLDERVASPDWDADELPSIYSERTTPLDTSLAPILSRLLHLPPERWHARFLTQILLPIHAGSVAANTRYLTAFLATHNITFSTSSLPLLPVKPKLLHYLLIRYTAHLPASYMTLWSSFVTTNISPLPSITTLLSNLQDPKFRQLPSTKHFLSLYGHGVTVEPYDNFALTSFIRRPWEHASSPITVEQMQKHFYEHATLLVAIGNILAFTQFMRAFTPPLPVISTSNYLGNAKVVVEQIIAFVDSLRTKSWQSYPARIPASLPSILQYKWWLLPFPVSSSSSSKLLAFASRVRELVEEICAPGRLYHEELPELQSAMGRVVEGQRAGVACVLGMLRGGLGLEDLLCVELARELFLAAERPGDEEVVERSRSVVRSWVGCANEGVRRKGVEVLGVEGMLVSKGAAVTSNWLRG